MLTLDAILKTTKQMTSYGEGPQFPSDAPKSREAHEARPYVCDWCGYRVHYPCKNKRDRSNCDNA